MTPPAEGPPLDEVERLREALRRLGSMEAFAPDDVGRELVARIDFARETLLDSWQASLVAVKEALALESKMGTPRVTINAWAAEQYRQVERIWPTPEGADVIARQAMALAEEVGEIHRAILKRSHAARSSTGTHKGLTESEWTTELHIEIGQALGVLLGLAHKEGVDIEAILGSTLQDLLVRPAISDS